MDDPMEPADLLGAPPVFSQAQIVQQLRTSWGGSYEGTTRAWAGTGPIAYYVGGTPYASGSPEIPYTTTMTALQQGRAALAFEIWDDLIARDLSLSTTRASAQIQFEYATATVGGGTYARPFLGCSSPGVYGTSNWSITRQEIWFNSGWTTHDQDSDLYFGGYGFQTYLHEIGHALGLSHSGTYNAGSGGTITYLGNAEYAQDNRQYTIMSYFGGYQPGAGWQQDGTSANWSYSSTPMVDDIATIQAIYGADTTTRTGNTVYGFNCNLSFSDPQRSIYDFASNPQAIFTIWDAGGIDTLDGSGYAGAQVINLAPGSYSSVNGMTNNVAIAYNCTIENVVGGAGNDTLVGNAANNVLTGGAGNDTMIGGAGGDTYDVDSTGDVVIENAGAGIDTVRSAVTYTLTADVENLTLTGTANHNARGNALANVLTGNTGDNYLVGGAGNDTMIGGAGTDTYIVEDAGDVVVENPGEGTDTVVSYVSFVLGANLERLILTGGSNVNATGNGLGNILTGNTGDNFLIGGAGNDTMIGGAGTDTYVVEDAGDVVVENAGEGTDVVLSSVSYTLVANVENLGLQGRSNINAWGNGLDNVLTGNAGDNFLIGGAGNDTMGGGAGSDTYVVDSAGDIVIENVGAGTDIVQSSVSYTLGANIENLALAGGSNINCWGNALDNALTGNAGDNFLIGGGGNDTLAGGAGSDTYVVDSAGDIVMENAGEGVDVVQSSASYTLGANVENLSLAGGSNINGWGNGLANVVAGSTGDNFLFGGTGNDTLVGGLGRDTLIGEAGNDVFVFRRGEGGGDTVVDFAGNGAAAGDALQFVGYGSAAQGASFVQVSATLWVINSADGAVHDMVNFSNAATIHISDYLFA